MNTALVIFDFYSCLYHLHLHSFPTRRSSDLAALHPRGPLRHLQGVHEGRRPAGPPAGDPARAVHLQEGLAPARADRDRKSTRLNSSHSQISYAVFCLKKKKTRSDLTASRSTL